MLEAIKIRQSLMARLMLAVFVFCTLAAAGCNTVEGVGKDVEGAGEAVQDAAD